MKRTILTISAVTLLAGVRPAGAGSVVGANGVVLSTYANPFDPAGDGVTAGTEATTITSGPLSAGTAAQAWSLAPVVNRQDGYQEDASTGGRLIGSATSGFMQFQAPSSFTVGTIISDQSVFSGFASPTPFTAKLDGTAVQSGPGTVPSHPIQVTTLPTLVNVSTLRLEGGMASFSGNNYFDINEVMLLPERLARIPATVSQLTGSTTGGSLNSLYDLNGYDGSAGSYWDGSSNSSIKLNFAGPTRVNALVVTDFENRGLTTFNIKDDTGTVIGNVQLVGNGSYGDYLPIRFDTPVTTSFLEFDFIGVASLKEIIAFTVPEPSTFLLFGLGGLLLRRRLRK